jgi:hypothetical protein
MGVTWAVPATSPGAIAFTVIPLGPSSRARPSVRPDDPRLGGRVRGQPGEPPESPERELMFTIRPPWFM